MKLPTTPEIRAQLIFVTELETAMPRVLARPVFWRRPVTIAEEIEFIRCLASARHGLWEKAQNQYPQLCGIHYTIGTKWITTAEDETE